jgi:hypothetical protein
LNGTGVSMTIFSSFASAANARVQRACVVVCSRAIRQSFVSPSFERASARHRVARATDRFAIDPTRRAIVDSRVVASRRAHRPGAR